MESTRFAGFKTGFLSTPSPKKNPKSPVETRENTTPDFAGFKTGFLLSPSPKKTQKSPVETRENTTPDMAILNKLNMFYVADPEGIRENISYNKSWYCASFIDILMSDVETEDIKVFPSNTLLEIREIAQQRARFVFIPLNVNYEGQVKPGSENHWVAIIIDRTNHQLFCLDPAAKVSAASLPANVSDFIIKNNYDVQFNTTNFQISEKKGEYGLIHCGPYTVEIFNKFKENLHIQQINLEAMLSAIAPASGEEGIDEVVINKIRRSHVTRVRELISNYANNPDLPKIDIVGKSFESLTDPLPKVTTFLEALYEQKFCWEKKYSNEARKLIEENAAEPLQKGVEFDKLNRKDHATKKSMPINIPFITPEVEPSDNLLENRASFLEGHLPYEVRIKRDLFWKFSNYCKDRAINEKLNNPKRLEEQVQENLDNRQWIRNRLDEYQQFADNLGLGRQELCHPTTMEDFLKKEVNWLYIGKISNLSLFHKEALQNAWVREQITNNMLSFPQFALSTPYGCNAFCNPTIQRFLEKEENRQYFSHVSVFSKEAEKALANAWVMDRIADGTLTFQQVAGVSPGGSKILRNPLVQNFFTKEENWLYIGQVLGFSLQAAEALKDTWVRDQFTHKMLNFQQIVEITPPGSSALCNVTIQGFLEQEKNQPYIALVSSFSWPAVHALENVWVRDQITDNQLTFQQLAQIDTRVSSALRNVTIQGFLEQEKNRPYIGLVSSFSWQAVEVLENAWVRKQIIDDKLTLQQLANINVLGSIALCNSKIQRSIDENREGMHITKFTDPFFKRSVEIDETNAFSSLDKIVKQGEDALASFKSRQVSSALSNVTIQSFLEQEKNQPYIALVRSFSWPAVHALENVWVRDQITDNRLTFQQLAKIGRRVSLALRNETIQGFLEQEKNRPYIGLVSSFSWQAVAALENAWVRKQIIDDKLTLQQLANINKLGSIALCTTKIQRSIDENREGMHITKFTDPFFEGSVKIDETNVFSSHDEIAKQVQDALASIKSRRVNEQNTKQLKFNWLGMITDSEM